MLMERTNYTVEKVGESFTVYDSGKIEAKGCPDIDSAMQAVWSLTGKREGVSYFDCNGAVILQKRLMFH